MKTKKQIVFIEPKPTVNGYRMARSLKLTKKYETVLFSFSKTLAAIDVGDEFFRKAYDKIWILELSHKFRIKNLTNFLKRRYGKDGRELFKNLKNMKPYLFQISGPDLFSAMVIFYLKNFPKVYYANDIWGVDQRNFLFTKDNRIKGSFQKFFEKICFKKVDGVITKKSPEEFEILDYRIDVPKMSLYLNILDEWMFPPKKKKTKEIHFTFGGDPAPIEEKKLPFIKILRAITSQKIYFHTYGPCIKEKENRIFIKEAKMNRYYCYHERIKPSSLTEEMSKHNYGVIFHFIENEEGDLHPGRIKTDMSSRMVSYLEAGLPVIVNRQNEYMANIVEKYGIGIVVEDFEGIKNIRKRIEKQNYNQLQENVKKVQEEFRLSKKVKDLEDFYENVIKAKIGVNHDEDLFY